MTAPLRTLVVDDEQPARARLTKLLKPMVADGRLHLVAEAADGVDALDKLRLHEIDLLFLDIRMPELDGFEVLERLRPEERPVVVFTTAYDRYALRAFEANAVDYLLKPISRERLDEAVARAGRIRRSEDSSGVDQSQLTRLLDWIDEQAASDDKRRPEQAKSSLRQISIPHRDRIIIAPVSRIISAEINEGITRIYLAEEEPGAPKPRVRPHIVNYTLDQLESSLDPQHFMRVHRSAIVQLDHIQEMIPWFSGRFKLVLTGAHEVIASRERSKQLKDELML